MEPHRRRFGKRRVSGPRRENASAGRALSNRPTAAATCASTSSGASFAAASNSRTGGPLPPEPLERDAVEELPVGARRGASPEQVELGGRREVVEPFGSGTVVTKSGTPRAKSGWSRFPAAIAYGVSGSEAAAAAPGVLRPGQPRPEERDAEVELDDRLLGVKPGEPVEAVDGPVRPGGERLPDARLERVESRELRPAAARRPSAYSRAARRSATASGSARTPSSRVNGRRPRTRRRPDGDTLGRVGLERGDPHDEGRGTRSRGRGDGDDARPGRHGATVAAARPTRCLDRSPMPSGRGRDAISSDPFPSAVRRRGPTRYIPESNADLP